MNEVIGDGSDEQRVVDSLLVPDPVPFEQQQLRAAPHLEGHLLVEQAPGPPLREVRVGGQLLHPRQLQVCYLHLARRQAPPGAYFLICQLLGVGQELRLDHQVLTPLPDELLTLLLSTW